MRTVENDEAVGDLTVEDHLVVRGHARRVRVPRDTLLDVWGVVTNGVTVDRGGRAVIYGICRGGLKNAGEAEIYGIVVSGIKGRGRSRVSPAAVIDGVRGRDLTWETTAHSNEEINMGGNVFTYTENGWLTVLGAELVETPLVVNGQVEFRGGAVKGVHVPANCWLTLSGVVFGGITVDPGGHVLVTGACHGGITNNGEVDIRGVVNGGVSGTGQTRVAPDAVIDGVKGADLRPDS